LDNFDAKSVELARLLEDKIDQTTGEIKPFDLMAALMEWENLGRHAKFYVEQEMIFRRAIFKRVFPEPKLGVNSYSLGAGYILKGKHGITYKIDEALFPIIRQKLAAQNVSLDPFIKAKYELVVAAYKAVEGDEDKNKTIGPVLREMITTKDSAPTLEITLPAAAAKAMAAQEAINAASPNA
jgi:hypothetical protein